MKLKISHCPGATEWSTEGKKQPHVVLGQAPKQLVRVCAGSRVLRQRVRARPRQSCSHRPGLPGHCATFLRAPAAPSSLALGQSGGGGSLTCSVRPVKRVPWLLLAAWGWHTEDCRLCENINLNPALDAVQQILYPQKHFCTSI